MNTSYTYDDYGNLKAHSKKYNRKTMRLTAYYDRGLVSKHQMSFAGGNFVYYTYDNYGNMVSEKFNSTVAWELLEGNARGQVVRERKGGVVTTYTYDKCGRITSIVAPRIISLHYTYDSFGNVLTKTDAINGQSVEYTYDFQNRLTSWVVNNDNLTPNINNDTHSITYNDTTGNIISKSDLGEASEFVYDRSHKPHALRGVNNVSGDWGDTDISISYTDFSKVQSIQRGTDNYNIFYDVDKERIYSQKTISGVATTRYYMSNHEVIVNSLGHETYIIYLCNGSIAIHDKAASTKTLYHGYYDAQGSLIALTDNSGNVVARFAYDPWGSRVSPTDWSQSVDSPSVLGIERGYTMHEHLDEFELINMNGRVYDPAVSQFLSPDPYIQDASNWLNYNRYAYCYNNPTRYVDPDGEFAISAFLLGMVVSAAIDYGMQVAFNHKFGYRGKDAWVNNVDFFDIAVSGAIGGLTAGCGASLKAGESIGRLGSWFVNNPKAVKLGELVLTSAVDITGNGFQNVESEMFGSRMLIGGMTWAASDIISGMFSQNRLSNESQNVTKHSKTEVRTTPNNLSEQLALEEAKSGMGISIMDKRLKDSSRIGWLKMSHVHRGVRREKDRDSLLV